MTKSVVRNEYPRPQFVRENWSNLNGLWDFEFDDGDIGLTENWQLERDFSQKINVPFCFQSALSGIETNDRHDIIWYKRTFEIPSDWDHNQMIIVHFGAVDYECQVWVNGHFVGDHTGGHTPFSFNITNVLNETFNTIVVRVKDNMTALNQPRGKQYWEKEPESIWYTRTTGIWQTVWLEPLCVRHLENIRFTPNIDQNIIQIDSTIIGRISSDLKLRIAVCFEDELVQDVTLLVKEETINVSLHLPDFNDHGLGRWWSPNHPNLYDVVLTLENQSGVIDQVVSYFGMRKISVHKGKVCLNNRPFFMKLVLDQGYFPEGMMTAPTDQAFIQDIKLTKEMGFNGVRKHQKIEDPRFLYWCDRLGLLVWGEMASGQKYDDILVSSITTEWITSVHRDYSHPCIVAWVPLNESWGINNVLIDEKQQHHSLAMYHLTKSLDSTRLVLSNDGWEHTVSDICTIHDYESDSTVLRERYNSVEATLGAMPAKRWIYVDKFGYNNEPVIVSEFGGIAFDKDTVSGWGYSSAASEQEFISKLQGVIHPLLSSPVIQGYCFTQLTDVEQEINGLLTKERIPKVPLESIRSLNDGIGLLTHIPAPGELTIRSTDVSAM